MVFVAKDADADVVGQRDAAEQLRLVRGGPGRPEPGHDGRLGLEPERLGVDQQPVHGRDSHGIDRNRLPQHGEPLVRREQGLLLIVNRHRHDDFVEKRAGPLDDIEMTVRHRIEAAGINRASHRQKFVQESAVATLIELRFRFVIHFHASKLPNKGEAGKVFTSR